eukprot:TRINITY_DN76068_c0_g1_i1.p1 TRINITY_DN76068_c0_g1~~TRINITY_DN76068_c0_g1_i1.p1  ORF type:complete len:365 (+),score=91.24 TRINITY_DN76068_c0_g1_i1:56-1150(+)
MSSIAADEAAAAADYKDESRGLNRSTVAALAVEDSAAQELLEFLPEQDAVSLEGAPAAPARHCRRLATLSLALLAAAALLTVAAARARDWRPFGAAASGAWPPRLSSPSADQLRGSADQRLKAATAFLELATSTAAQDRQAEIALCTIDVAQSAAYLAQAALAIQSASHACPDGTEAECTAVVGGILLSFLWTASYLSEAANACGVTTNQKAACAADVTCLAANLGDVVSCSATMSFSCHSYDLHPAVPPAVVVPDSDERKSAQAACSFDAVQGASYLGKAGLSIRESALDCPVGEKQSCAVDVLNLISSFAWAAQFFAQMGSDCPIEANVNAACGAAISDLVAAVSSLAACGTDIGRACKAAR